MPTDAPETARIWMLVEVEDLSSRGEDAKLLLVRLPVKIVHVLRLRMSSIVLRSAANADIAWEQDILVKVHASNGLMYIYLAVHAKVSIKQPRFRSLYSVGCWTNSTFDTAIPREDEQVPTSRVPKIVMKMMYHIAADIHHKMMQTGSLSRGHSPWLHPMPAK